MGTIVNVICSVSPENPRTFPFIFDIEDGSAVIHVLWLFYLQHYCQPMVLVVYGSKWMLLQAGHTLEVKGVPQMYSSSVEVKPFSVCQVIDPNDEIDRSLC